MQWHRWWRYWSDDEDTNDEEDYEEEYREPPVTKKLRCLKERHEQALNAENIADQEVQKMVVIQLIFKLSIFIKKRLG